ncbi:MAG TPA: SusC/RagA family TonB-linked outer membrane protein [Gemmatimonadaceae bacterium]|jgi:TonB-linked SusC/RagA family outer membrane protein|nr:SusC/RagA family TonB-linked outer membrane protein [Gemmatimonadaceae bacterium]
MKRIRSSVFSLLLLALFSASAFAQTRRVSGRVTVEGSGEPLVAASVNVVGTALGTYTDDQGRFSLNIPEGSATLRVRRIGYAQKTIAVPAGATDLNVELARDVLQLETQVVTGTATTVSSANAANAVTVVSSERLNRVPAQTIDYALQGKVPGALISQNSGAPGGGTQIQLRGVSTLNAGFLPLYVIDGVIVDNSSISNGLNVISQSARGNFASSQDQTVNRASDINPNDIESVQILKGPSASSIYGSRGTNGVIIITTKQGVAGGKPTLDINQRFGTARISNKIGLRCFKSGAEVEAAGFDSTGFGAATNKCHDYEQELYGEHPFNYQTIGSLRGGTSGGTTYFISGLVQHDGGLVRNDNYNKQSLRVNVGQTFGSRLHLRANVEGIHTLTARGISGNDNTGINPYTTFSQTPSFIDLRRQGDGTFPRNPITAVSNSNPFQNAELIKTPEDVFRMLASGQGVYNLMTRERQTLDFTVNGGLDSYIDHAKIISPATAYVEQVNALPGTLFVSDGNVMNATLGASFNHRLIRDPFTATTSFGFGQVRRNTDVVANTGRGVFPGVTNVSTATQIFTNEGQSIVKSSSFFVQEEFLTMAERLLLTAGVNSERTSNNGDAQKYYAYPKFSASYRMPTPRAIDELKLRLAYGRAGNQPTGGKYTFLTNLIEEGVTGFRASTVKGFPGIKPETASETEGGFDLTFFTGRARLSATQFRKQIDNLILSASVAPSTGFSTQTINGGQIVTHGTELELGMTPIQSDRFSWISNTTYSSNKGKVTRLPVPGFIPSSGSFGTRFGNAFVKEGQLVTVLQAINGCTALVNNACPSANRVLTFVGNSAPDYEMGFNNDLTFGSFRLSSLFDWRKGGLGINLTNAYFDGGLGADTAAGNARALAFSQGTAAYVENSGFVKLRELTLGYELPANLTSRLFNGRASQARVELSGRNLKTWTKYTGLDPEVSNFGNQPIGRFQDVTPYPPSRTFFLTINTTF